MAALAYSHVDRLIHRVAFCHRAVQDVLADIEDQIYGRLWRDLPVVRPIFVTSLPRAGTTLLLEVLSRLPGIATHRYRDMPFVRAPVLWQRLSGRFQTSLDAVERAHGDGMRINPDSPEAFEETIWLARCPDHYRPDGIRTWTAVTPRFAAELAGQMRRIVALRREGGVEMTRYLSKNNANIGRIAALRAAFPDADIVVPLRDPLAQARSMHRQHLRFSDLHARDAFARRYMADIGHFEFGALHRPILFEGVADVARQYRPDQIEYWIGYWSAAFRHVAAQDGVTFVDHAGFCQAGGRGLQVICERLGLDADPAAVQAASAQIMPNHDSEPSERLIEGLDEARRLYSDLSARSLFGPTAALPRRRESQQ